MDLLLMPPVALESDRARQQGEGEEGAQAKVRASVEKWSAHAMLLLPQMPAWMPEPLKPEFSCGASK